MEVSHTELQAFLSCQEFYKKKYLQKIYPRTRPHYFVIGSAVHAFKDVYYKTKQQKLGINAARKVFEEVDRGPLGADDVHKLECDLSMVEGICEAYPKFYSQDFDEYTSFMTEQKLTMPLVEGGKGRDPIRYKGYLDFLAQEAAGDWWVVDTKTTTSPNADYFRKVHIDSQLTGYMWLAKELLGEFPKGVIYDVIKKPSIRLKKGENQRAFRDRVKKEYTLSMVEGICEAYPKFYSQDFDEYTSFMTEQKLTMPLVEGGKGRDPIRYKGYLDFLAQEAAGDWWVVDTKTTTSPNADYFRKVHIDSQLTGYMWLAKELLGEFPKGVIYDVIKKPSIRLKKGENQRAFRDRVKKEYTLYAEAKGYFVREEIIIGKRQLDRWFRNTQHIAEMIQTKRSIKTKVWPMNTGNCQSGWGSSCQYLEICITGKVNKLQFTKGGD